MNAALHSRDGDFADVAEDELAGVADGGGFREIGNFGVRDLSRAGEFVGEGAEAGTEDQGDFGAEIGLGENKIRSSFGAVEFGESLFLGDSFFRWRHL